MNDETWPALKWVVASTQIWKTLAIIIPLASAVVFAQGWMVWRHAKTLTWQPRVLVLAALIILTATLVEASGAIHYYFYCSAIYAGRQSIWQSSEKPLADMNLCYVSTLFAIGIVVTAFCLSLALLLPKQQRENRRPTTPPTVP